MQIIPTTCPWMLFWQGSEFQFSLSMGISWEWQGNLGISRNPRMYPQPGGFQLPNPNYPSWYLQHSKGLLRTSSALPELGMQQGDPTHLQLSPSVTQTYLELTFLPRAVKRFSKGCYRSPQFPQKNVLWFIKDPPLFWKLITLRWSILGCFDGLLLSGKAVPHHWGYQSLQMQFLFVFVLAVQPTQIIPQQFPQPAPTESWLISTIPELDPIWLQGWIFHCTAQGR